MTNATLNPARARTAQLFASAVEVICGACGNPQANPDDGSFMWDSDQLKRESGKPRTCQDCDAKLILHAGSKATIAY